MQQHIIIPPYLKPGDTIGITAPAGYVSQERVAYACEVLRDWGFKVVLGKTIGHEHFYFSGNDEERLQDLQAMLNDPDIKCILMGRGGYGMTRIIDKIDFTAFAQNPKWICGFSDITVLHQHILQQYGIAVMHTPMCGSFTPETEHSAHILSVQNALQGRPISFDLPHHPYNRNGAAAGTLVGGNLAIMAHLTGSASQVDTKGCLLFIEDIGEHLYNIDRMLHNLKRAGKLEQLAGVIIGSFTDNQDTERPFGSTWEQIVRAVFEGYDYPLAFGLPCGHQEINFALKMGVPYAMNVQDKGSALVELPTGV